MFVFLGADQDAYAAGGQFGVAARGRVAWEKTRRGSRRCGATCPTPPRCIGPSPGSSAVGRPTSSTRRSRRSDQEGSSRRQLIHARRPRRPDGRGRDNGGDMRTKQDILRIWEGCWGQLGETDRVRFLREPATEVLARTSCLTLRHAGGQGASIARRRRGLAQGMEGLSVASASPGEGVGEATESAAQAQGSGHSKGPWRQGWRRAGRCWTSGGRAAAHSGHMMPVSTRGSGRL